MLKNKRLIPFLMLMIIGTTCLAQSNSTNSPYSRYGYGRLGDHSIGMSRAMGGIGYGLRTSQQINPMNPASYTAMDSLTFLFDIGADFQKNWFKEGNTRMADSNGGLDYVALQFPLSRRLAVSAGLLPYSFVGYNFMETTDQAEILYNGEGGLTMAYMGLGATLFKGFNVGLNINYLFGNISYVTNITPTEIYSQRTQYENVMQVNNALFQIGAQYTYALSENDELTLGAVYTPAISLRGSYKETKSLFTPSNNGTAGDYNVDVILDEKLNKRYELPNGFGVGLTYSQPKKLTVGIDATFQQWANAKYANKTDSLSNRFKIAVGAEYVPDFMSNKYLQAIRYRVGAFYDKSYLNVKNHQLSEYGVSCGLGFPLRGERSIVNVGFEYVRQPAPAAKLLSQDYFRVSLGLTFNELWFFKPKLK